MVGGLEQLGKGDDPGLVVLLDIGIQKRKLMAKAGARDAINFAVLLQRAINGWPTFALDDAGLPNE